MEGVKPRRMATLPMIRRVFSLLKCTATVKWRLVAWGIDATFITTSLALSLSYPGQGRGHALHQGRGAVFLFLWHGILPGGHHHMCSHLWSLTAVVLSLPWDKAWYPLDPVCCSCEVISKNSRLDVYRSSGSATGMYQAGTRIVRCRLIIGH